MKFNVQKDPDSHYLEIINLRHPRDDRSAKFIFNNENNTICEILKFSLPHRLDSSPFLYRIHLLIYQHLTKGFDLIYRSWFIGNYINSDGSMYLSTSIDPLFLVLPYLFEVIYNDSKAEENQKLFIIYRILNILNKSNKFSLLIQISGNRILSLQFLTLNFFLCII